MISLPDIRMSYLVPRFIKKDKNGDALTSAIATAMTWAKLIAASGLYWPTYNVDLLLEWQLDELAWEYNCIYHYGGSIEQKRAWIHEAIENNSIFGTPQSIVNYMKTIYEDADIEEYWEYSGDPFHFRITTTGSYTADDDELALYMIERAKPVRCICDGIVHG